MSLVTLYGLKACDGCRKAARALEAAGHEVRWHDVRTDPLDRDVLEAWVAQFGEALVNRRSTTWRGLAEDARAMPAAALLAAHPAVMKRPVIEMESGLHLGWTPQVQAALER